ncbi:putative cell wall-binding domain [hydrocarbon metagenome]|uniref:Putative cell wall-binding domain n=1 Tax=hydrocarbon metagenome TaxID=938273 RepID=A0A0W8EAB8_9ZZZZ
MGSSNVTLYAKWTINQYTISFNSNGGSSVTAITQDYGTTVSEPAAPTRTGYTFAGWYSDSALTTAYTFTTMSAENITLYAKWTALPTYTVSYNGNGNTGGSAPTDSNAYYQDDTVTVLGNTGNLTKTGYTFAGWNTAANGSGDSYNAGDTFQMGTANRILYAQWSANDYYVYYTNNTGTGSQTDSNNPYNIGEIVTVLDKGSMAKEGYTFTGWNTAANGSGTAYAPAATFSMPGADVTLYAQWTAIATHAPTITVQPQDMMAAVGEQASFDVEYTGFPEPDFQWQLSTNNGRKWSNIAGANSDTYITPAATSKMNGYKYRVKLSNNLGSVISEAATLTVSAAPAAVADVSITKTGIYNLATNTVTWTITLSNSGPDAAEGVVVADNLSNNCRVLSVTTGYNYKISGKKVIFEIGTLGNGSSVEITVIEALVIRATGEVTNTATVTTTSYDPDLTNNTDTKSITIL